MTRESRFSLSLEETARAIQSQSAAFTQSLKQDLLNMFLPLRICDVVVNERGIFLWRDADFIETSRYSRLFPEIRDPRGCRILPLNGEFMLTANCQRRSGELDIEVFGRMTATCFASPDAGQHRRRPGDQEMLQFISGSEAVSGSGRRHPVNPRNFRNILIGAGSETGNRIYESCSEYAFLREFLAGNCEYRTLSGVNVSCSTVRYPRIAAQLRVDLRDIHSVGPTPGGAIRWQLDRVREVVKQEILNLFQVSLHAVPMDFADRDLFGPNAAESVSRIAVLDESEFLRACDFANLAARPNPAAARREEREMAREIHEYEPDEPDEPEGPNAAGSFEDAARAFSGVSQAFDDAAGIHRAMQQSADYASRSRAQDRLRRSRERAARQAPPAAQRPETRPETQPDPHAPIDPKDYKSPKRKIVIKKKPPEES